MELFAKKITRGPSELRDARHGDEILFHVAVGRGGASFRVSADITKERGEFRAAAL